MRNAEVVTLIIDDVEVVGVVDKRTSYGFGLEITKPFKNLSSGAHIPYFARGHYTIKGEVGDNRIREELRNTYALGQFLKLEMYVLKQKWCEVNDRIAQLSLTMFSEEDFRSMRMELRKRLRRRDIDNKAHQQLLQPLKKLREHWKQTEDKQISSFFDNNFPVELHCSNPQQIIDILTGKKSLHSHTT